MRGHITERRPGVFRIHLSGGSDAAGRRKQITRTVKGGRRDAERELTRMLRDLDEGRLAGSRQPLERYLAEWVARTSAVSRRGRPLAPTTRARYAEAVAHASREIGRVQLVDLRPAHIEAFRDALLGRGMAPETVSGHMRVICQALARAEAQELVRRNPADPKLVNRPAGPSRPFVVIDAALGQAILAASTGTEWDAPVHLALGLGLRREEVLALRWEDVDDGILHVRRALTQAGGKLHIGEPKSDASRRDLPLPGFVAAALLRHRTAQTERLFALGIRSDLIVGNPIGEPFQPATFSSRWKDFASEQGFGDVRFHGLRHGCATLMLASGIPDAVAASTMGHSTTRLLGRYRDVVDELQLDAAARMDRLLGGERG